MQTRYIPLLLAAAGLAFACGPRSRVTKPEQPQARKVAAKASLFSSKPAIGASFDVNRQQDRVRFALLVTNDGGKRVELTFPNGKTHDFVVLDAAGREVWRWSEGRMFTQPLQNKLLGSRDRVTYEEQWTPGAVHGTFTAVAILHSENYPIEQRTTFTIE